MSKHLTRRTLWLSLAIFYVILTFAISSIPGDAIPTMRMFRADLIAHLLEYGLLAWLIARYLSVLDRVKERKTSAIVIIVICGVIGWLNELWQSGIAGRYASVDDAAANVLGASIAVWLFRKKFGL